MYELKSELFRATTHFETYLIAEWIKRRILQVNGMFFLSLSLSLAQLKRTIKCNFCLITSSEMHQICTKTYCTKVIETNWHMMKIKAFTVNRIGSGSFWLTVGISLADDYEWLNFPSPNFFNFDVANFKCIFWALTFHICWKFKHKFAAAKWNGG